jgi:recombination protein RecA
MSACPHVDPSQEALAARGVRRGCAAPVAPPSWRLSVFAGRLGEISGSQTGAALTLAFRLMLEAQRRGEPVAWISRQGSAFFPPDAAETGVDLAALAVIWVRDARQSVRAADYLVRSGAFGLVALDLGQDSRVPVPVQSRLVGLAKKHDCALLCLTEKGSDHPSLGSLVSVRAQAARTKKTGSRFRCEARILKDKRQGPGWTHTEVCRGPAGLR